MGTEVYLIVTGDINSPIKNCCATLEILVMLKKSDSTRRQHNFLFYRDSISAKGPHSYVIPASPITFIIGLIELRKIKWFGRVTYLGVMINA